MYSLWECDNMIPQKRSNDYDFQEDRNLNYTITRAPYEKRNVGKIAKTIPVVTHKGG